MCLIGAITIIRAVILFVAQMAGAIVAAFVVSALFTGGLNVYVSPSPVFGHVSVCHSLTLLSTDLLLRPQQHRTPRP